MLCSCLWALYPRIVVLIFGFCTKLERFIVYSFCTPVRCSGQTVLLGFTFNRYVHCSHVVVRLLLRDLVAGKTHNYYIVGLDGCVYTIKCSTSYKTQE